ncbi:MAG: DUF3089 domain-containing protein [Christensenellaceae bacterium]
MGITNYEQSMNWLAQPKAEQLKHKVDVFYVYPTAYLAGEHAKVLCSVDNVGMRIAARMYYAAQATAFEPYANIYAPFYRQADGEYCLRLGIAQQTELISQAPLVDMTAAFEYYMQHDNNGRPFLLVGHSQGAMVLKLFLQTYMSKHPEIQKQMIAAYVIGYSITNEYMQNNPHLKFAEKKDDTGVIISYNTEAPKISGINPVLLEDAICINPISWTRTAQYASERQSKGSRIAEIADLKTRDAPEAEVIDTQGIFKDIAYFADAQINLERGTVMCRTADIDKFSEPAGSVFGRGVYHSQDFGFYYYDLRQNAWDRIHAYLNAR